jgi:hypothetical protein
MEWGEVPSEKLMSTSTQVESAGDGAPVHGISERTVVGRANPQRSTIMCEPTSQGGHPVPAARKF